MLNSSQYKLFIHENENIVCEMAAILSRRRWVKNYHSIRQYSNITWAQWCLISSATQLLLKQLVQGSIKENSQASHHWPCVMEIRRIPITKDRWYEKRYHFMT